MNAKSGNFLKGTEIYNIKPAKSLKTTYFYSDKFLSFLPCNSFVNFGNDHRANQSLPGHRKLICFFRIDPPEIKLLGSDNLKFIVQRCLTQGIIVSQLTTK